MIPRFMVFLFAAVIAVLGPGLPSSAGNSLTGAGYKSQPSHPNPQQSWHHRGQPGYNIVSTSSVHLAPPTGPKQPLFRGGLRARASSATTSSSRPLMPLIASGSVLFNSLNKPGLPADNVSPPDSTGAIGPNNYLEMDNAFIAVYDRNLNTVASTTIDNFAGQLAGVPFCDPQVQWDNTANRWLMSFLYCNTSDTLNQTVFFAWSATSDPSNLVICPGSTPGCTGWCGVALQTNSLIFDFDKLGHSAGYLVIGGNFYDVAVSATNPPFNGAALAWASLPASGDTSCSLPSHFGDTTSPLLNGDGSTFTFTPVPVNQTSNNSDVWIVSAYDPAGNTGGGLTTQSKLATWDLDGAGVLHQRADVNVNSYQAPTAAAQLGSSDTLDTLDGRLLQAVGNASAGIWTQHTVLDSSGRSEVDWYELVQSGLNLTLFQQGNIDTTNAWTFNAAISPRWDAVGTAIFYNVSSTTQDPSIVAQTRRNATPLGSFDAGRTTLAISSAADTDFSCKPASGGPPCRWGDYSGASPDPIHQTIVWGTNEFNTPETLGVPAWRDENFAVHVANTPASILAAPVARSDGRGDVALTWTPPQFEPDACPTFTVSALVSGIFATSMTVTGLSSAAQFRGLTAGTTYTFTVLAVNCGVPANAASPPSNPVTIDNAITSDPGASAQPRPGVTPEPSASPQPR
jgi:hypothetical protein